MSYLITLFDEETIVVSDEQGLQIQAAKVREVKNIRIGEDLYATGAIAKIKKIKPLSGQPEIGREFPPMLDEPLVKKETIERVKKELKQKFNWK